MDLVIYFFLGVVGFFVGWHLDRIVVWVFG